MSPDGLVRVERVWKRFRADQRRRLLRDELQRLGGYVRGDPGAGWRWVLRDVSFEVAPGESVGLVGLNGSGKSTLLKLVSGVMFPYAGSATAVGRVGAMIDVRAGLHPELTGRENVRLYGRLLGLGRREAIRRFDEIVDFGELEDAIDRQVKFYSSGMAMRLGFSIAAHLDPALLVVDEVLAVGDAAFQQKCLDRMRDVLEQGTTLLYVSHNLATVTSMCSRAIWLDDGEIRAEGSSEEVVHTYRRSAVTALAASGDGVAVAVASASGADGGLARSGGSVDVRLVLLSDERRSAVLTVGITQGEADPIVVASHAVKLPAGEGEWRCRFDQVPLPRGTYPVWLMVADEHGHALQPWRPACWLTIDGPEAIKPPIGIVRLVPIWVPSSIQQLAE